MSTQLSYLTLAGGGQSLYEDRKSRFLGHAAAVATEEQALCFLKSVRETYRDASHHCYAWRLRDNHLARYSDDGEPAGTAGLPMMEVLSGGDIVDVIVVVTRYFGGVLLGTGGLVRAYTKSTQLALENAGINEVNRYAVVLITCPYSLLGTVQNLLPEHNCIVEETDYAADVTLTATLPEDGTAALEQALRDATSANADMEIMDTQFMGRRIK